MFYITNYVGGTAKKKYDQLTSSHLLLEHLDHVVIGAGTADLTQQTIKLALSHEDTNVVEGTSEVIFVNDTILVDVHHLEAVLVHVQLLLRETALILAPRKIKMLCTLSIKDGKN